MEGKFELNRDTILALIGIVFFIVLALIARGNVSSKQDGKNSSSTVLPTPSPTASEEKVEENQIFKNIESLNYHFTYSIVQDDMKEVIDGKVNGNKQKFSIIGETEEKYAKLSESYLLFENGSYKILNQDVRSYFPYIELSNIYKILELSSGKEKGDVFVYRIDTTDLLDLYTEEEYDGFDDFDDDTIQLYFNSEKQVVKIEIDYSNYFTYVHNKNTKFHVMMEFDSFGEILELDI